MTKPIRTLTTAFVLLLMGLNPALAQQIHQLSFFSPLISSFEAKLAGNHLLVSQQGQKVFDLSNTSNPQQGVTVTYPGSYAYQLEVQGKRAYMSHGGSGHFTVYDIANPANPLQMSTVRIPATAFLGAGDLVARGSYAYLGGIDTLYVIDVRNGAAPQVQARLPIEGATDTNPISSMVIGDSLLFILSGRLTAYSLQNPASPQVFASLMPPEAHGKHNSLAMDGPGRRVFMPWGTPSAQVDYIGVDVYAMPTVPNIMPRLSSDSMSHGFGDEFGVTAYYNNILFVTRSGNVIVFDADPSNPGFRSTFSGQDVPNASVFIPLRDSVFVNARRGGFEVLEYNSGVAAVQNRAAGNALNLWPNPARNALNVEFPNSAGEFDYTILSAIGAIVMKGSVNGESMYQPFKKACISPESVKGIRGTRSDL